MASESKIQVYTDGGYSIDRNIGAWAIVVVQDGEIIQKHRKECKNETSQRMELKAFIAALMLQEEYDVVEIFSDSAYTLRGYDEWMFKWQRNGWKRGKKSPVKNEDLWREIFQLKSDKVSTFKVKAHSGNKFNEIADGLCKTGEEYKNHEPINSIYLTDNNWYVMNNNNVFCELTKTDYLGKLFITTIYKDKINVKSCKEKKTVSEFEGQLNNILEFKQLLNLMRFESK